MNIFYNSDFPPPPPYENSERATDAYKYLKYKSVLLNQR